MLLVKGVYSLCKDSICVGDIKESSVLLKTFVYYKDKLCGDGRKDLDTEGGGGGGVAGYVNVRFFI